MKTAAVMHHRYSAPAAPSLLDVHTLSAIDAALGTKDRYTQEHARRVALYAIRLARRIGLSAQQAQQIGIGGLLHDVGKIGLSSRIFNHKNQRLGKEMRKEVQQHPRIGADLLESFGVLAPVIDYVRCHHERLDGSGYPCGLTADKIPMGARIISVVDCFDAITTDRPYQKRKSCRQAFRILRRLSGKSLDATLVEAFIAEVEENGILPANGIAYHAPSIPMPAAV